MLPAHGSWWGCCHGGMTRAGHGVWDALCWVMDTSTPGLSPRHSPGLWLWGPRAPELGIGIQSRPSHCDFGQGIAPLTTSASCPHPVADSGTLRDQASVPRTPGKNSQPGQSTLIMEQVSREQLAGGSGRAPPVPVPQSPPWALASLCRWVMPLLIGTVA